jgi:predicted dehydrogenase
MIAQVIRFWPHYLAIKKLLDNGELGAPVMAQAARLGSLPAWSSWYADPALSGGALLDLHIHDLDWLYYLFGMPKTVYAIGRQSENGSWNQILSSLNFGACQAAAEASLLMPKGFPFTMIFRLLGDKGYAEYQTGGIQANPHTAERTHLLSVCTNEKLEPLSCVADDPYEAEIRYFIDCLNEGRTPETATLAQARDVLRIAMAVRQSLESGQVVTL